MEIPGKIQYIKKATIDVLPNNVEVILDGNILVGDNGHYEFVDQVDYVTHTLTLNGNVTELYIENIPVHNLVSNNVLQFSTPIYKWLFSVFDNK